jgi:hypothetical protein
MELETPASIVVLDVVTKLSPANGAFWRGNCSAFSGVGKSVPCPEIAHLQLFIRARSRFGAPGRPLPQRKA